MTASAARVAWSMSTRINPSSCAILPATASTRYNRKSRATWSFRDRPVWSLPARSPINSPSLRSTALWTSSSVSRNSKDPDSASAAIVSSPLVIVATSSLVRSPTSPSIATCASDPLTSTDNNRLSDVSTVKRHRASAGPSSKRPPDHRVIGTPFSAVRRTPYTVHRTPYEEPPPSRASTSPPDDVQGRRRTPDHTLRL